MANPLPLVAYPGDDVVWTGTVGMTNEDADYPAENVQDADPAKVAKATGTSTTITVTTSSVSVVGAALINTNAETATVNGVSVTIPALEADGQRVHGWLDRRTNPLGPATSWSIALSRSSGVVWIGRICLVVALRNLNLKYGLAMGRRRPGDVAITTRLGSIVRYGAQIRTRWAQGSVDLIEDATMLHALEASAKGTLLPFLFIPDELADDAWFVSMAASDFSMTIPNYDVREITLSFEELSGGPPNG